MTTTRPSWHRTTGWLLTAAVVLVAVLAGAQAGTTLALWRDRETGTLAMPVGVTVFGVGAPAAAGSLAKYATADGQSLTFEFGPAQAAALYGTTAAGGAVAVPVQVDSLAQGHRGLSYTVSTSISGGVFGASRSTLYKVGSPQACTTSTTATATTTSTPWTTAYTDTTTLMSEYWCLVARFVPVTGTHTNTATVTGTPVIPGLPAQPSLTATDTWTSTARQTLDPAAEPTHRLTFTFSTTRPGGAG
ncbi:hypothetical protein Cfla_2635 [Cellulomonas flavigena DSM 20109]|uniref:Uncharacterized protein n=1 Tax=Cellulomonas flavigena (strain ATCC 482 / DSM 20109 / BCRC 11376 / JCM 18109 / NBRC 3775 / NCIMB 8073 / NRS 134) TaxID=446466 RepID=D5UIV6_CELFN|nr:hypothetical protein [Cellulomonas flavigena]ADG75522.1 hypothetical protein Cfla_2635 [Cellulomonas flavigena DSM 20109]